MQGNGVWGESLSMWNLGIASRRATFAFPRGVRRVCGWFLCLLHKKSDKLQN